MNWNGILITSTGPTQRVVGASSYRGLCYGEPWPLARQKHIPQNNTDLNRAVVELTTGNSLGYGIYPPAVIVDLDVVSEYVQRCHTDGLQIRVLLCGTPRSWPLLTTADAQTAMNASLSVGFDYAYSTCDFSAVFSDLNPPPSPELQVLSTLLNQNGVFSSLADLQKYITARWDFITNAERRVSIINGISVIETPLEDSGDFIPFKVLELSPDLFLG